MFKVKFDHKEVVKAANFVDYCHKHNIETTLHNDSDKYVVNLTHHQIKNLYSYLLAVPVQEYFNKIGQAMLER